MIALLTDEPRRREFAKAARRRAEAAFDIRDSAAHLIKNYQDALM
jgi:hypothetical protein